MENNLDNSPKMANFAAEKEQMIQSLLNAIIRHYGSLAEFERQHNLSKNHTRRTIETMLRNVEAWERIFGKVITIEILCNQQQQQTPPLSPPPKSDED